MHNQVEQSNGSLLQIAVWRGDTTDGHYEQVSVPRQQSQTILDVVTWIQRHKIPDLAYRFACRVGMCGSCAMMVNGEPRWTCRTHVGKVLGAGGDHTLIEIAPLRNLPVIKDLVTDMNEFFSKWQQAEGRHHATASRHDPMVPVEPDSAARQAASAGIECINCAVCYAACDVVSSHEAYLGPAALNRAWTLLNDERDGGRLPRLQAIAAAGGCHSCHSQQSCARYCPNELNPTRSIAGLKRMTTRALLKGELS